MPDALVGRLVDASDRPVRAYLVSFRIVAGGGTLFTGASLSDDDGVVRDRWTLGVVAGDSQVVEARALDNAGAAIVLGTFRATAVPGPAASTVITPPATTQTAFGSTIQYQAAAKDTFGNLITGRPLTWFSSDTTVARINSSGLATTIGDGTALITGTVDTRPGSASVTVTQRVSLIQITPDSDTLVRGATRQLAATLTDANGNQMIRPVTWSTADSEVATVASTGLVSAVGRTLGPVSITGSVDGTSDASNISVVLTFNAVSSGSSSYRTCAITADGTAYCWGDNAPGHPFYATIGFGTRPTAVTGGLAFTALASGEFHTCGLTTAGAAYCWGLNDSGQLGDGGASTTPGRTPVPVSGGLTFSALVAGLRSTCGIATGGAAYCWGVGHLGGGSGGSSPVPIPVSGGLTFSLLTAGVDQTCGIATGGDAYCWGYNNDGQLGTASGPNSSVPVPVAGELVFTTLASGEHHTCGVTDTGPTYCWGSNDYGTLGDGSTTDRFSPVPVLGGLTFIGVTGGLYHSCGLTSAGTAYCWGTNDYGEGGRSGPSASAPVPVSGGLTFSKLVSGLEHTCGMSVAGKAYCWGHNAYGALGDGTTQSRITPVRVLGQP